MKLSDILAALSRFLRRKEATMQFPSPNPPTISPENQRALTDAYQALMTSRAAMINGMAAIEDSPYRRGVMVDALISGLMAHFHEFARNESVHSVGIRNWGVRLPPTCNDSSMN